MPAPNSKKKVLKYSDREKLTAVRLSETPGVKVKDVAAALDLHPFMLSRWRRDAREGRLGVAPIKVEKRKGGRERKPRAPSAAQVTKYAKLKKQHEQLQKEHAFLKKFDRFRAQMKAKGSRSSRGSGGSSE
jgi:transposase